MTFLACAVAVVASFYILLTQGLAVLAARRTGVLIGKSPSKVRVERTVDPEYFDELLDARAKALRLPAFIAGAAIIIFAWTLFAVVSTYSISSPLPR
jgi:hypothetical protein